MGTSWCTRAVEDRLDVLRQLVLASLVPSGPAPVGGQITWPSGMLLAVGAEPTRSSEPIAAGAATGAGEGRGTGEDSDDSDDTDDSEDAYSTEDSAEERERLIALVELARDGDKEAFGLLYDHYHGSVYRFLLYRTRSVTLAEDLCSETFFRALRRMGDFKWQGRDFGAWLTTIARNLTTDHFKAGRTRLEHTVEDVGVHDEGQAEGTEAMVMATITNELLMEAIAQLPAEQQDCLVMRFLQGLSIAETAAALERSEGAVKQLQLRGVRNLAKLMPEGMRE